MTTAEPQLKDSAQTVSRSSLAFLSGTLCSRVTGLGRDMAMAFCFGSHPAIAAFMVAFRFANVIRRLFGEGPLAAGFIPHFEQLRAVSPEKGAQFFRDLLVSLSVVLLSVIGIGELILLVLWKWGHFSPDASQILLLTLLMLPGILFICLFGLSSGLLQCERRFFLTGFAPVAFNLVWIGAAFYLQGRSPSSAVIFLALAVVLAFFLQWLMVVPHMLVLLRRSLSVKELFKARIFSPEMRQVVRPFLLGILGVSAVQINSALDALFARFASLEGPAYLWYAIRLEQFPLALFGIALSAALLPPLSRAMHEKAYDKCSSLLRFALRRSFSLIFPCTLALFVCGAALVNLLFGRGDFTQEATYHTVLCLWGYGLGLVPAVFVLLLAPAFYAQKEFRIPTLGALYSVCFNILLSAYFVFVLQWGAFSIAVATSLSAWVNYFYLSHHLTRITGAIWDSSTRTACAKTGLCALLAAAVTLLVGRFLGDDPTWKILWGADMGSFSRVFSAQMLQGVALGGTFCLILFSYAWMLRAEDLLGLFTFSRSEP